MSTLMDRICGRRPAAPRNEAVGKDYMAAKAIPLTSIMVYPNVGIAYDDSPLVTSDGAPIPASSPGQWGQLYRAGR